jgi:hypothetical protein
MKRRLRRLAWVGVALTVVALAFGVTVRLLGPEPPGVTATNVRRIRVGMTLQQVKQLLGPHMSDNLPPDTPGLEPACEGERVGYHWPGVAGEVVVWVRDGRCEGRVDWITDPAKRYYPAPKTDSPLDRLRSLLGLQSSAGQTP